MVYDINGINIDESGGGESSMSKMGMFKSIGLIGDSFTAGVYSYLSGGSEVTAAETDIAWGNQMCRKYGITPKNYGWGGATVKKWLEVSNDRKTAFDSDAACDAYFVAFGINDKNKSDPSKSGYDPTFWYTGLGTKNDAIGADTFYAYLKKICEYVHAKAPHAPIFIVTPYKYYANWNEAIKYMATIYDYVFDCDIYEGCPYHLGNSSYFGSHPTRSGYSMLAHYFDKIVSGLISANENAIRDLIQ